MNEKFMKVMKFAIPTLTVILIASQLFGIAVTSQQETLDLIQKNEMIEIEIAVPKDQEQGTESSLQWIKLASLETDLELRNAWDNILGITGTVGNKNGVLYVNRKGNQELNNTLREVLNNKAFLKVLEEQTTMDKLTEAVADSFVDIEADSANAFYMGLVRYFNLLPGTEEGYANPDKVLERAEAMTLIMRAEQQVNNSLTEKKEFTDAVGKSDYNLYAQMLAEDSYLDLESNSLNNKTYNSTMSRAEYVYMLVNRYFSEKIPTTDASKAEFEDAVDGGDIAAKQGYADKQYGKSYELVYMINSPDEGVSTDLYKALAVALELGIVDEETRWDEGIQLDEAAEMLFTAYTLENNIKDFDSTTGVVIYETPEDFSAEAEEQIAMDNSKDEYVEGTEQAPSETPEQKPEQTPEQETPPAPDFVVEAVNKTMYALQSVNLRQGPSADTAKVGDLTYAQEVTVTGVVHSYKGESCLWYQLSTGEFASGAYLTVNKPQQSTTDTDNSQEENTDTEIPEFIIPEEWGSGLDDVEHGDGSGGGGDYSDYDGDFRF